MTNRIALAVAALAFLAATPASAQLVTHEDGAGSFRTVRGPQDAPVSRLTVTSQQSISGFGIDIDPNGNGNLDFLIFNSDTGSLLFQSGPQSFTDVGAAYYYSNPFSFTFNPGTTYGLTATSSVGGSYFVDFQANTVGAFNFLTGNQNVSGTSLNVSQNCCDVGTALVLSNVGAVPEPGTWALMLIGFGAVGVSMRRRRSEDTITQMA